MKKRLCVFSGASCYMNCILQQLFMSPEVRRCVLSAAFEKDQRPSLLSELQVIFLLFTIFLYEIQFKSNCIMFSRYCLALCSKGRPVMSIQSHCGMLCQAVMSQEEDFLSNSTKSLSANWMKLWLLEKKSIQLTALCKEKCLTR